MARKPVLLHLSEEELEKLDELVAQAGRSRSAVVREAITRYVATESVAEKERRHREGYERIPYDGEFDALNRMAWRSLNEDLPY